MKALTPTACATPILLALAVPAYAEVLTVEYEATLGSGFNWPAGVVMSGTLLYDTDATGSGGVYPAIFFDASFDGLPFIGNNPQIQVFNDLPVGSDFLDQVEITAPTNGLFDANREITHFRIIFSSQTQSANPSLESNALPGSSFTAAFPPGRVIVNYRDPNSLASSFVVGAVTRFEFVNDAAPVVECEGFYEPFDVAIGLDRKTQRVIPLKLSLLDEDGIELGPDDITAPAVSVSHTGAIGGGELEELVESAGRATSGNSFVWDDVAGDWQFNLTTKPYSSVGTYTVRAVAGDDSYAIDPTCTGTFVRQ